MSTVVQPGQVWQGKRSGEVFVVAGAGPVSGVRLQNVYAPRRVRCISVQKLLRKFRRRPDLEHPRETP